MSVPPLRLDAAPGAAGDLSRFAGVYAGPDRQVDVTATADGLLISSEDSQTEALPFGERAFLVDPADPDNPTVTSGAFDPAGRPQVLYDVLWDFRVPADSRDRRHLARRHPAQDDQRGGTLLRYERRRAAGWGET